MKDIWRLSGQQWDENILDHIVDKFVQWIDELTMLTKISILRSYFKEQADKLELHVFCDSSQDVFWSVAFLRGNVTSDSHSRTELAFVFLKTRVAPTKPLTITKLELQAALLVARLGNEIQLALTIPVERTFMWTDSTTVLQWLQSRDKLPVFVANRLADILELTTTDHRNYVQTPENPADARARGLSAHAVSESHWLKGSDFLTTDDWLFQPSTDVLQVIKRNKSKSDQVPSEPEEQETTSITANVANNASTSEWQKYSSYEKLLRIVAYMLRSLPKSGCSRTKTGSIDDPAESEVAQQKLFQLVQDQSLYHDRESLVKFSPISKTSTTLKLSAFIGANGLLRAKGRTQLLEFVTFGTKHPVILDARHPFVRLFLKHLHESHCHHGEE